MSDALRPCWLAASLDKTIRSQLDTDNVKRMYEWVVNWIKHGVESAGPETK